MHETAFADAARPARYRILGLDMLDYSIGHELILLRWRNPLLFANFDEQPIEVKCGAIRQAAWICSRRWKTNNRPPTRYGEFCFRFWLWRVRNHDPARAISEFQEYRERGSSFPPVESAGEGGRALGAPFHAGLVKFMATFHMEPFDSPLGLSQWLFYSDAEREGSVNIINAKESEFREKTDRFNREVSDPAAWFAASQRKELN